MKPGIALFPAALSMLLCASGRTAAAAPMVGPVVPVDAPVDAPNGGSQTAQGVAFDGTNYLVVWSDGRDRAGGGRLYGARVDKSGVAIDARGFKIADDLISAGAVAFGGGEYLACWTGAANLGIGCARIDTAGKVLDPSPIVLSTRIDAGPVSVAWNGTLFLVAWDDGRTGQSEVYAARVTKAGVVQDAEGFAVAPSSKPERGAKVASDGKGFFIVWGDDRISTGGPRAFGARVGADGSLPDPQGLYLSPTADSQFYPAVCFDGASYHVAWEDTTGTAAVGMRGALVSPAGVTQVAEIVVSATTNDAFASVACGSGGSIVAWRGGATRIDRGGHVLDPSGLTVPLASQLNVSPRAGSDGANFLLVWNDTTSAAFLVDATVSAAGAVAPAMGRKVLQVSNTEQRPALARGASGYLAVWNDDRSASGQGLYELRLDDSGAPLGAPTRIATASLAYPTGTPSVAWNGTHFLVTWVGTVNAQGAVGALRVDAQGKLADAQPFTIVANTVSNNSVVGVASDDSGFFVVWTDTRNSPPLKPPMAQPPPDYDIYGARVGGDGTILDKTGVLLAGGTAQQTTPVVAFDGTNYMVAWVENQTVRGLRVGRAGTALDAMALSIGTTTAATAPLAIAFGQGNYLVSWFGSAGPRARRFAPTGAPVDATDFLIPGNTVAINARAMAASWGGQSFLVAWTGSDGNGGMTVGARVGPGATRPDQDGFAIEPLVPGEPEGQSLFPTAVGLASDGNGRWVALSDRFDPAPSAQTVRVRSRLITDCTGAACPSPPDGGVSPPDGSAADGGVRDAPVDLAEGDGSAGGSGNASGHGGAGGSSAAVGTGGAGGASTASGGAAGADGPVAGAAGGTGGAGGNRPAIDGGSRDTGSPSASGSSGCACSAGGPAETPRSKALGLALIVFGLGVVRARRRTAVPACPARGGGRDTEHGT